MLKRVFINRTNNTYLQAFRYIFVGTFGFITDFAILYYLTSNLKLHYLLSAIISFIVAAMATYIISIVWVFKINKKNSRIKEFIIFALIGFVGLIMTILILWALTNFLKIHYLLSKVIASAMVFVWNFMARKKILFSEDSLNLVELKTD